MQKFLIKTNQACLIQLYTVHQVTLIVPQIFQGTSGKFRKISSRCLRMFFFSMISLSLGFLFDVPSFYLNRCVVLFLDF